MTSHMPKNSYTKKTNTFVIFSILWHNLSKFVTQTGLYCSKQLETTFNQVGKKSLHITFKPLNGSKLQKKQSRPDFPSLHAFQFLKYFAFRWHFYRPLSGPGREICPLCVSVFLCVWTINLEQGINYFWSVWKLYLSDGRNVRIPVSCRDFARNTNIIALF